MNYAVIAVIFTVALGVVCLLLKQYDAAFFMVTVANIWSAAGWVDSRKENK